MAYLIGTDEAGYGPNLGPLIISASAWEVPDGLRSEDLYRQLDGIVAASPAEAARKGPDCASIADSKVLYQSGKGLRLLERGLLAALAATGHRPRRWCEIWEILAPQSALARTHSLGTTGMKLACRWIAMRPKSTILLPCFRRAWPKPESG